MKKIVIVFQLALIFLLSGCQKDTNILDIDFIKPNLDINQQMEVSQEDIVSLIDTYSDSFYTIQPLCEIDYSYDFDDEMSKEAIQALFTNQCNLSKGNSYMDFDALKSAISHMFSDSTEISTNTEYIKGDYTYAILMNSDSIVFTFYKSEEQDMFYQFILMRIENELYLEKYIYGASLDDEYLYDHTVYYENHYATYNKLDAMQELSYTENLNTGEFIKKLIKFKSVFFGDRYSMQFDFGNSSIQKTAVFLNGELTQSSVQSYENDILTMKYTYSNSSNSKGLSVSPFLLNGWDELRRPSNASGIYELFQNGEQVYTDYFVVVQNFDRMANIYFADYEFSNNPLIIGSQTIDLTNLREGYNDLSQNLNSILSEYGVSKSEETYSDYIKSYHYFDDHMDEYFNN